MKETKYYTEYFKTGRKAYISECPRCKMERVYYRIPKDNVCSVCKREKAADHKAMERKLLNLAKANIELLKDKMSKEEREYWV